MPTELIALPIVITEQYSAPKPARPWRNSLARILFPPILLWDAAKWAINSLVGERLGRLIVFASTQEFKSEHANTTNNYIHDLRNKAGLSAKRIQIKTHDNVIIDTLEISACQDIPKHEQRYIINFSGNAMCFEQCIPDLEMHATSLACNVIGFNYRGVGQSTGKPKSKDQIITDGIAQVQRLLDQGVDPEKITLDGYSLGGAVAAIVGAHFHEQNIKVNVFNRFSFSTITNFVVGMIRKGKNTVSGHQDSFENILLASMLKPLIKFFISLSKWEMHADNAFKKIPTSHREYIVARSSAKLRKKFADDITDDGVIRHYSSLHVAMKGERKNIKSQLDGLLKRRGHNRIRPALLAARARFKERKMMSPIFLKYNPRVIVSEADALRDETKDVLSFNAHEMPQNVMQDRYRGQNANSFFYRFVIRADDHHTAVRRNAFTPSK